MLARAHSAKMCDSWNHGRIFAISSNNDTDAYPNNSASHFRNTIDKFGFTGGKANSNLKIALFKSFIPRRFRNISDGECQLHGEPNEEMKIEVMDFNIPIGFYSAPADVCAALNKALKEGYGGTKKTVPMHFAMKKGNELRALVKFKTREFSILLSDNISEILGFPPGIPIRFPDGNLQLTPIIAPYTASALGAKSELYVYINCIEKNWIASRALRLLTILHWVPGGPANNAVQSIDEGFLVWHNVSNPDSIDNIEIIITDSTGEEIDFYGANSVFRFFLKDF